MCLTQTASVALDMHVMMTLLAVSFILINIIVANYLVHAINIKREHQLLFRQTRYV